MAGVVHPREAPRPTRSVAEREVYEALRRALPDGWVAWHSLRLRVGRQWEGEGDFVIAIPNRGLLVLEVKGGRMELRDGRWFQNGTEMTKAPRDQAQAFVRNLAGALSRRGVVFPAFGVACVFPDVDFSVGPTTPDLDGLVLGRRDLPWITQALKAVADRALPRPVDSDDRWMSVLHELWGETWVPHVRLRDRIADAEQRAVALNEDQLDILEVAGESKRALVTGPAGTGKTIIGRELCLRRARSGGSALFLCFTDALAMSVGRSFAELDGANLQAIALRRLALDLTDAPAPDDAPGWHRLLRAAAVRARSRPRYDLVVVDETQDLEEADWALVEALTGPSDFWAFRDPAQSFWPERYMPERIVASGFATLRLRNQQRNPPSIAALAALYRDDAPPQPPPLAPSDELRVVTCDPGTELDALRAELDRLVAHAVRPDEIAVVSLAGQLRSEVVGCALLGAHELARADAPEAGNRIIADTFLRFKGLERPFVIVVELDRSLDARYDTRMHIALTRATAGCAVLASREVIERDPRLRSLASPIQAA